MMRASRTIDRGQVALRYANINIRSLVLAWEIVDRHVCIGDRHTCECSHGESDYVRVGVVMEPAINPMHPFHIFTSTMDQTVVRRAGDCAQSDDMTQESFASFGHAPIFDVQIRYSRYTTLNLPKAGSAPSRIWPMLGGFPLNAKQPRRFSGETVSCDCGDDAVSGQAGGRAARNHASE